MCKPLFVLLQSFLISSLTLITLMISMTPAFANADDVAVVIGNRDYSKVNTRNVEFAGNDAEAMRAFLIDRLGFEEQNIIFVQDATLGQMRQIFGDDADPAGKLWNWSRKGRSKVFVFYSGHGAAALDTREAFLMPVDVDPNRAAGGYSLKLLDSNLSKLKQYLGGENEVILMLDACFSGQSAAGALGDGYSGGLIPNITPPSQGIIRLAAAGPKEVANWDAKRRLGLFTSQFLTAIDGAADKKPYGDGDGRSDWQEIVNYLADEIPYYSSRQFGRRQTPELPREHGPAWQFEAKETEGGRKLRACREEPERWAVLKQSGDNAAIGEAQDSFLCPAVQQQVAAWLGTAPQSRDARTIVPIPSATPSATVAPPLPSQPAVSQTPPSVRTFRSLPHTSIEGGDLGSPPWPKLSFEQCRERCVSTSACIAFSHDRWSNLCFLKSSTPSDRLEPSYESAILQTQREQPRRSDAPLKVHQLDGRRLDESGQLISNARTWEACQARCMDEDDCWYIKFTPRLKSCEHYTKAQLYRGDDTGDGVKVGVKMQAE